MKVQFQGIYFFQIVTLFVLFSVMGTAKAVFMFTSESAVYNPNTKEVLFTITFNQNPDFFSTDSQGRQSNSFQYFIVGDPIAPYPGQFDAIIRGEEIHIASGEIRIRNSMPSDVDPFAGGWGTIRGVVPYNLNGNVLTFSTPLQFISNHSLDGSFAYQIESYEVGGISKHLNNHSIVINTSIVIDIKPHSFPNLIHPVSKGSIEVAILSTGASDNTYKFDAITVIPATVRFGSSGATATPEHYALKDIDKDGDIDIVFRFNMLNTNIKCGDISAVLIGETINGQKFEGTDSLKTVGCKRK